MTDSGPPERLVRTMAEVLGRRSYLRDRADSILLAGGLKLDAAEPFCGALWIIEAETREIACRLAAEDPFTLAGLWQDHVVYFWNKAPGFGTITL